MKELLKITCVWIAAWLLVLAPTLAFAQNPVAGGKAVFGGKVVLGGGISAGHSYGLSFNGSTDALNSSATVDLTSTSTVSVWFWAKKSSFTTNQLAVESSSNYNSNNGAFIINFNDTGCANTISFAIHQAGVTASSDIPTPSINVWHSYMFVFNTAGNSSFKVYVDGISQTVTTCVANTPGGNLGNYTVYLNSRGASSLFNTGSTAEFAMWKADESANASTLNGGTLPSSVDASNLVRYAHLCGTANPEPDIQSGSWIYTGTPSQVTGPGVLNCP
jgi:hypothetical protein